MLVLILLACFAHRGVHLLLYLWVRQLVVFPILAHVALHATFAVFQWTCVVERLRLGALSLALELFLSLRDRLLLDEQSLWEAELIWVMRIEALLTELFHVGAICLGPACSPVFEALFAIRAHDCFENQVSVAILIVDISELLGLLLVFLLEVFLCLLEIFDLLLSL